MNCDRCEDLCPPDPYDVAGYPELHFCCPFCFAESQAKGWVACMEEKEAKANTGSFKCLGCGHPERRVYAHSEVDHRFCSNSCESTYVPPSDQEAKANKDQDACSHCGIVSMTSACIPWQGQPYCSMECSVLGSDKATANNDPNAWGSFGLGPRPDSLDQEATANTESDERPKDTRDIQGSWSSVWVPDSEASPLSQQVGGDHYLDMAIQPFEYIHRNGLGFGEGSVIKYVSRWRNKNGVEDLRKAKQVLELMIAEEES